MPDIKLDRYTRITLSKIGDILLYPADDLYPSDDLYPRDSMNVVDTIVSGTLQVDELLAEGDIKFGAMLSNRFEVQVFNAEDVTTSQIFVSQEEDEVIKPIFFGYVDSAKKDKVGDTRTIVAYDAFYSKGSLDVANWWNTFWTNKEESTLKDIRESLLDYVEIRWVDKQLINDNLVVKKNIDVTSMRFSDIFPMICELSCCIPNINRTGYVEFITLHDKETTSIQGDYEGDSSTFEEFEVQVYTGIKILDSNGSLKRTYLDATNPYTIGDNVFLYDKTTDELDDIAESMFTAISSITYRPASIKMIVSDTDIKLGDLVSTEFGSHYVLHQSYDGVQLVEQLIECKGNEYKTQVEESLDSNSIVLNQKIATVNKTVEDFLIAYEDYQKAVATQFKQTADSIGLSVLQDGTVVTKLAADINGIGFAGKKVVFYTENFGLDEQGNAKFSGAITGSSGEFTKSFHVNVNVFDDTEENEGQLIYPPWSRLKSYNYYEGYTGTRNIANIDADESELDINFTQQTYGDCKYRLWTTWFNTDIIHKSRVTAEVYIRVLEDDSIYKVTGYDEVYNQTIWTPLTATAGSWTEETISEVSYKLRLEYVCTYEESCMYEGNTSSIVMNKDAIDIQANTVRINGNVI